MFIPAAIIAALLAISAPGAAVAMQPAPAESTITIPFDPPLGRPLVYRGERSGLHESERSAFTMTLEFARADDGFVMTVQDDHGSSPDQADADPALARRRFRVAFDGELVAMLDEAAYWRAAEALLQADLRAAPGDRNAQGALWAMRQERALPTAERMDAIARDGKTAILYAGAPIMTGELGGGPGETEVVIDRAGDDAVLIRVNQTMPPEAMEELRRQYDPSQPGLEGRVVAWAVVSTYEVDRRTGLTRAFRTVHTLTTEHEGARRAVTNTETLHLVE